MLQLKDSKGIAVMQGILWIGDNAVGERSVKIVQKAGGAIQMAENLRSGEFIYYRRPEKC